MKLTSAAYQKARNYLLNDARELDRVRYLYEFEDVPADQLIEALLKYQNDDGGFGRGLEPDLRTPTSSTLASYIALSILGCLPPSEALHRLVKWLKNQYNKTFRSWPIIPSDANDHPRAPWWDYTDKVIESSLANPGPAIVSTLLSLGVQESWVLEAYEAQIDYLRASTDIEDHELICFCQLADAGHLVQADLVAKLMDLLEAKVASKASDLDNYGLRPRFVITSPQSLFYEGLKDRVEVETEYLFANQNEDGSWKPNWSWFGSYPETWPQAEAEWSGNITYEVLSWLARFDRLQTADVNILEP